MIYGKEIIINFKYENSIDKSFLSKFIKVLCKKIDMKRYGKTKIIYFGKDRFKGFSVMQFITTSSIIGHFTETEGFVNVFSCKEFDKRIVIKHIKEQFNIEKIKYKVVTRIN